MKMFLYAQFFGFFHLFELHSSPLLLVFLALLLNELLPGLSSLLYRGLRQVLGLVEVDLRGDKREQ